MVLHLERKRPPEESFLFLFLLHHLLDPLKEFIWHIAEWHVDACRCGDYRTAVAESQETVLAVVRAHTRVAHAAERHLVVDNMHDHIVHTRTTRGGMAQDIIAFLAEVIQRQRTLALVDELRYLLNMLEGHHREDRTEDFLLHHRCILTDIRQDSGAHIAVRAVILAAVVEVA